MHSSFINVMTLTLAALSGTAAALGLTAASFSKDLSLASQLGISPDLFMEYGNRERVHLPFLMGPMQAAVDTEWTTIPVDHEDESVGTYQNRYWVSEDYYRPGGPIIVYDVGETSAQSSAMAYLAANKASFFSEILKEFNGMGIVWEHRYYGESLPFPISNSTPPEHFKYLTTEQALADIPYFAQNFTRNGQQLSPDTTPWVMVGGSYSGIRSAFTRDQYPDTIFASYASSAPVEARIDMSIYFDQVYAGMVGYGHENCTKDIKAALEYIDGELSRDETSAANIKTAFFGAGAEENNNGDFSAALAGIYGYWQAYGMGGGEGSLGSFCEWLETDPDTNSTAGPEGFAASRGNEYAAMRYASWPIFTQLVNFNYNTNCDGLNMTLPLSCVLNPPSTNPDDISWTWQFCSEWGYFQSDNLGPHSLLSQYQSLEYWSYACHRQFPDGIASGLLPKQPQTDALNKRTGGWTIRPSNVYWSGGQFDPWRTLSPLATESWAPQGVTFSTDIPQCNVKTGEDTLFGYIMPNAEHCFDFDPDFGPGKASRGLFQRALKEWLPCFEPRT
ncbi:hypothetical protein N7474_005188 [Penicillium riverlandense]|uniref:uncharacterized protein n=1 Tax=Penicillium riverlandense TaxID=1903569 RepID=UPI002549A2AF|nr:uncharacterized protein N7474_005188 [Penicillium riverlandense]KAJ5819597.1 hypothetical protein N7474_005188 [Penicillium riverlandense]